MLKKSADIYLGSGRKISQPALNTEQTVADKPQWWRMEKAAVFPLKNVKKNHKYEDSHDKWKKGLPATSVSS